MRIVAIWFLAAVCLLIPGPVIAGSPDKVTGNQEFVSVQQPEPNNSPTTIQDTLPSGLTPNDGNAFYQEEFVYIPPPESRQVDPRFYTESFEFVPSDNGQSGGILVQPVWGAIPISQIADHKAVGAPKQSGESHAAADATPTSAATATATPTPTLPTPSVTSTPTATPERMDPPAKPTSTSTTVETKATTSDSWTPTPSSVSTQIKTPIQYTVSGTIPDDIEDPRFYRGSYVYDSETRTLKPGMIGAPPAVPEQPSSGPVADCSGGACQAPSPSQGGRSFPRYGRAMYYNPGIMSQVLSFRLETNHVSACGNCVGYVALLGSEDLNRKVWIEWPDGEVEGPFLVIDCAAKQHVAALMARDWVVDVDYATAMRHGMNRPLPVTVWDRRPGLASAINSN